MLNSDKYGVIALLYEFLLSSIIYIGGGILIFNDLGHTAVTTMAAMAITAVTTFWFQRRSAENSTTTLMNAIQQQAVAAVVSAPVVAQSGAAVAQAPASQNAAQYIQPTEEPKQ